MNTASNKNVPFPGMKLTPEYFGDESWIVLEHFFASLCSFLIEKKAMRERFKADTGTDLACLLNRSPLDEAIDDATGFQKSIMAKWCDWVTLNHWGVKK